MSERQYRVWRCRFAWLSAAALVFATFAGGAGVAAQDDLNDSCPLVVEQALSAVGETCRLLERNEACYGHTHVLAEFWEPRPDLVFDTPADQVALVDLHRLAGSPLDVAQGDWGVAVLSLQADLPDTLPGQAVTFLLMGDATLENAVLPSEARESVPTDPVTATTVARSNLRRASATQAEIVATVPAGSALRVVGVDSSRKWYQVALEGGGTAWLWNELATVDAAQAGMCAALPVTDGTAPPMGARPMQAFYFSAGLGLPVCQEAPSALVIQNPANTTVTFSVNGLEVALGSTVVLTTIRLPPATAGAVPTDVMVMALAEGSLIAHSGALSARLDRPGATLAVTLNAEGRVDGGSTLVDPSALGGEAASDAIRRTVVHACANAVASGVLRRAVNCEVAVGYDLGSVSAAPGADLVSRFEPVYYCQALGDGEYQWYSVRVFYAGDTPVREETVGGPFTGAWQPGCPATGAPDAETPAGSSPAEPPPVGPH